MVNQRPGFCVVCHRAKGSGIQFFFELCEKDLQQSTGYGSLEEEGSALLHPSVAVDRTLPPIVRTGWAKHQQLQMVASCVTGKPKSVPKLKVWSPCYQALVG